MKNIEKLSSIWLSKKLHVIGNERSESKLAFKLVIQTEPCDATEDPSLRKINGFFLIIFLVYSQLLQLTSVP